MQRPIHPNANARPGSGGMFVKFPGFENVSTWLSRVDVAPGCLWPTYLPLDNYLDRGDALSYFGRKKR
ncbi:uncharacterized protein LAJ45_08394 [Morchella importuna]|uniref:uncharacterized protein n=1 Tax=Morchella importuna TaxID=1174673 RepID=UPI001E8DAE1B|nr:uncharacterized protein LAJ45_08394 [Morchella importuna]KAH8147567.1 hypothetical protein LAJ45_08394 [Morchella importuna]